MNPIQYVIEKIQEQGLWEKTINLQRNEYLHQEGAMDSSLYFVVSGSLKIFFLDDYEEHIIRFGYRDNLIAALDSFITDRPSDLNIQAIKSSELLQISKSRFMKFVRSDEKNVLVWQDILGNLIHQQMERERDLLTSSPLERYRRVLARSPQLFQEIPSKHIASYLRMTPETLSRIKKS